jgi:hypothetical protein
MSVESPAISLAAVAKAYALTSSTEPLTLAVYKSASTMAGISQWRGASAIRQTNLLIE